MRLCSIASGSSGNCIYVGSDHTHLLVDTGISKKRIDEGLHTLGIKGEELSGILITHEHSDHIQGLGVFSRKYGIPVYATKGTLKGIMEYRSLGKMPEGCSTRYRQTRISFWETSVSTPLPYPTTPTSRPDTGSPAGRSRWRWLRTWEYTTSTRWRT